MGNARNIAFWLVLFLLILALFNLFSGPGNTLQSKSIKYSEFVSAVEDGSVSQVTLDGENVRFRGADGKEYVTIKPQDADLTNKLIDAGIPPAQIEIAGIDTAQQTADFFSHRAEKGACGLFGMLAWLLPTESKQ